jgi:hypothetical protein
LGHLEQDVKVPLLAAEEDTGHFVRELIVTEGAGKNLIAYRAWVTVKEIAESFSGATGLQAEAVTLPKGHFPPEMPEEMQLEFGDNFAYVNEFGYEARNDATVIHPQQVSFRVCPPNDYEHVLTLNAASIAPSSCHSGGVLRKGGLVEGLRSVKGD